jgi:predicted nuclease of predicted toxin-antitoxin system
MDENVPRQITSGLRLRGVDVLTVQEENRAGLSDPEVLERATELQRVLFSRDEDLLAIANQLQQTGKVFLGVIYAHQQNSSIGDCVQDLELISKACAMEDFANHVLYLPL